MEKSWCEDEVQRWAEVVVGVPHDQACRMRLSGHQLQTCSAEDLAKAFGSFGVDAEWVAAIWTACLEFRQDSRQVTVCKRAPRCVQDAVWGMVAFPDWLWVLIQSPVVQRLRHLHQTGWLHLVYPCAEHSRLPHSLGTAFLAQQLLMNLREAQPELGITDAEVATVMTAALCHDVGHGPYSHAFEHLLHGHGVHWSHEDQSVVMVQFMVRSDVAVAAALADQGVDLRDVCEMIMGRSGSGKPDWRGPPPGRQFLWDIVSNSTHGLDVDKLDYISRDHAAVGVSRASPPDTHRLLRFARVVQDELAWPVHEAPTVAQVFQARQELHRASYMHQRARAVQCMMVRGLELVLRAGTVVDAVTKATLTDVVRSPEAFLRATDVMVDAVVQGLVPGVPAEAMAIFNAVAQNRLWTCVYDGPAGVRSKTAGGSGVLGKACTATPAETSEDIIVDEVRIHRGLGDRDPLQRVPFFTKCQGPTPGTVAMTILASDKVVAVCDATASACCESLRRVFVVHS
jgi:HD superfamily phosphohydrolase